MQRAPRLRMILLLVGLGIPGLLSLLPLLPTLLKDLPPGTPPFAVLAAISLLQSLLLLGLTAALGAWLAARNGLDAPALTAALIGQRPGPILKRQFQIGFPLGVTAGLLLILLEALLFSGRIPAALWVGIVGATLLFGLGHLPATAALVGALSPLVVIRALVMNGLPGLLFGWLFARKGLESAIFAHMGAHVGMFLLRLIIA